MLRLSVQKGGGRHPLVMRSKGPGVECVEFAPCAHDGPHPMPRLSSDVGHRRVREGPVRGHQKRTLVRREGHDSELSTLLLWDEIEGGAFGDNPSKVDTRHPGLLGESVGHGVITCHAPMHQDVANPAARPLVDAQCGVEVGGRETMITP